MLSSVDLIVGVPRSSKRVSKSVPPAIKAVVGLSLSLSLSLSCVLPAVACSLNRSDNRFFTLVRDQNLDFLCFAVRFVKEGRFEIFVNDEEYGTL